MYNNSLLLSDPQDDILTIADKEKDAPIIRYLKNTERFRIAFPKEEDIVIEPPVTGEKEPDESAYPPVLMPPQPEGYLKAGKYDYY